MGREREAERATIRKLGLGQHQPLLGWGMKITILVTVMEILGVRNERYWVAVMMIMGMVSLINLLVCVMTEHFGVRNG